MHGRNPVTATATVSVAWLKQCQQSRSAGCCCDEAVGPAPRRQCPHVGRHHKWCSDTSLTSKAATHAGIQTVPAIRIPGLAPRSSATATTTAATWQVLCPSPLLPWDCHSHPLRGSKGAVSSCVRLLALRMQPTNCNFANGLLAQWIRRRPPEPEISGSSPGQVISMLACTEMCSLPTCMGATQ
jgi:hypothetical protein